MGSGISPPLCDYLKNASYIMHIVVATLWMMLNTRTASLSFRFFFFFLLICFSPPYVYIISYGAPYINIFHKFAVFFCTKKARDFSPAVWFCYAIAFLNFFHPALLFPAHGSGQSLPFTSQCLITRLAGI